MLQQFGENGRRAVLDYQRTDAEAANELRKGQRVPVRGLGRRHEDRDYVMHGHTEPADDVAVRIGIELREPYDPGELRPEHIEQAIERHRAELEQTGMIR
ncbi:hypothetical protein [Actinophytocola algeriensis]|uniref:Uncharacterized protein n=1 Tax=Actinophytocola algeriensis TaxID=1768010 RepID=A0A7W7VFA4_9PSEU|nr:hypothetical protein [Actinophytocola algeriensis]MBB4908101.1 hypothetical protein [Actinophytocola algeriensis]MBE1480131.1 hypothetical protein [Actinophytocola algeriensis]